MMDHPPYLRIRLRRPNRQSRLTLSLAGAARALQSSRLPESAEALMLDLGIWVPLKQHPRLAPMLSAQTNEPEAIGAAPGELGSNAAETRLPDPDDVARSKEYTQFLARTMDLDRRAVVRNSGAVRASGPARILVAGGPDEARDAGWLRHLLVVQRWAAAL